MGKFTMTSEQKDELKRNNTTTPAPLEGSAGQSKGTYHNPVTGQEIRSLADPRHMALRLRQGWQWGPASPELREKWVIRQAELSAENDAYVEQFTASSEHREAESTRFNDAVASAVAQVLEKLDIDLPGKGAEVEAVSPAAAPAPEVPTIEYDVQLPLVPSDAASETDLKHVVSEASRPDIHLVKGVNTVE